MNTIDKILCELIVPVLGDHGRDLVELGHMVTNGTLDEIDTFGIEIMQTANHIADLSNKIVAASDPEHAKELQPKFDKLKAKWEEEYPGIPFLR